MRQRKVKSEEAPATPWLQAVESYLSDWWVVEGSAMYLCRSQMRRRYELAGAAEIRVVMSKRASKFTVKVSERTPHPEKFDYERISVDGRVVPLIEDFENFLLDGISKGYKYAYVEYR